MKTQLIIVFEFETLNDCKSEGEKNKVNKWRMRAGGKWKFFTFNKFFEVYNFTVQK